MSSPQYSKRRILPGRDAVKAIFDHFRNYVVCGVLFYTGITLIRLKINLLWFKDSDFSKIIGWVVIVLASVLVILNALQFDAVLSDFSSNYRRRRTLAYVVGGWIFVLYMFTVSAILLAGILSQLSQVR